MRRKKTKDEDPSSILTDPIDPEILERMPKWFNRLREAYQRRDAKDKTNSNDSEQGVSIDEDEFIRIVKLLIKHLR